MQRSVIDVLGLTGTDAVAKAEQSYDLLKKAYEEDDTVGMYSHAEDASHQYANVIDARAGELMNSTTEKLNVLINKAAHFSANDLPKDLVVDSNYEDLKDLKGKYKKYQNYIIEFESGISQNSRTVMIGSTQAEIDSALDLCKTFREECEASWYQDELERRSNLTPFVMDATEVTVSEFAEYADKYSVVSSAEKRKVSSRVVDALNDYAVTHAPGLDWSNTYAGDAGSLPVVHITQQEAATYCAAFDKRLPSEAEWEIIAGGYEGSAYPWGDEWDASILHWDIGEEHKQVKPVASSLPTSHGQYDLVGSVSEWTSTFDKNRRQRFH